MAGAILSAVLLAGASHSSAADDDTPAAADGAPVADSAAVADEAPVAGGASVAHDAPIADGDLADDNLADDDQAERRAALKLFEQEVRPLLVGRCYKCHRGDDARGELRLDSRAGLIAGGASGPAIEPGVPEESLLLEAVRYESLEMPPDEPLSDDEIAALERWIALGAPWPETVERPAGHEVSDAHGFTADDLAYWAFQPLAEAELPAVSHGAWCHSEIDYFILAALEEAGLRPAPEADRRTLVRRLALDLTGLPPSADEVERFLADDAPGALERLVERLLASPAYGERWARHWLDLVRYAESDGFKQDDYRDDAWRYRDYVIRALNNDLPYDRFLREQLAGDELAPDDPWARVATGLLRHGVYEYNQRDALTQRDDIVNEVTDLVGELFLGLGFGCARCHDHKFDPLLQEDYYRLQAFFSGIELRDDLPFATAAEVAEHAARGQAWEAATAALREELDELEAPHLAELERQAVEKFPHDVQAMYRRPAHERNSHEQQVAYLVYRQVLDAQASLKGRLKGDELARWEQLRAQLATFDQLRPEPLGFTRSVSEFAGPPADPRLGRGESQRVVEPGYPAVLAALSPRGVQTADGRHTVQPVGLLREVPSAGGSHSSGRRTALAEWLTDEGHALAARVMVNRVWHFHFGRGIVATTSDFGRLGESPSHPELLDWLADRFVRDGWSLKELHRRIVCSATYRQSARHPAAEHAVAIDPQNRLLWRWRMRRMEAEVLRDSLLAATGELEPMAGGPSVEAARGVRSIYTRQLRNRIDPLLAAFDAPAMITSTPERSTTTTPLQSLLLLNGRWVLERGEALARRVRQTGDDDAARVDALYQWLFARSPSSVERDTVARFLTRQRALAEEQAADWRRIATPSTLPGRDEPAIYLADPAPHGRQLHTARPLLDSTAPGFTFEAVVALESIYDDAAVRVIASEWDGDKAHHGWAVGITSRRSKYEPQNLIVQWVGRDESGATCYEVVAANLHVELARPYYLAVSVDLAGDEPAVTFVLEDLAAGGGARQVRRVGCQVRGDVHGGRPLVIGAVAGSPRHAWHGHLASVQLTAAPLPPEELGPQSPLRPQAIARFTFSPEDPLANDCEAGHPLRIASGAANDAERIAWDDLCHTLLTSSELMYLD